MTATRSPRGRYRTGSYEAHDLSAFVSDGTMGFDVPEHLYRERGYNPTFEALPTREEYEANGGRVA